VTSPGPLSPTQPATDLRGRKGKDLLPTKMGNRVARSLQRYVRVRACSRTGDAAEGRARRWEVHVTTITCTTVRAAGLGLLFAAAATIGGAGEAAAAPPIAPVQPVAPVQTRIPLCVFPHGSGPGYNASIGTQENGKTVCITLGEKLLVSLSAPASGGLSWSHIQPFPHGILAVAPLTLMLPKGVTATNFLAVHPGVVNLTSERRVCPPATSGSATCEVMILWRATIVVQAGHRATPKAGAREPIAG
jgi:hypothetical protein